MMVARPGFTGWSARPQGTGRIAALRTFGFAAGMVAIAALAMMAQVLASTPEAHVRLVPAVPIRTIQTQSVRLPPWVLEQLRDFKREVGAPEGTNPVKRPFVRPHAARAIAVIPVSGVTPARSSAWREVWPATASSPIAHPTGRAVAHRPPVAATTLFAAADDSIAAVTDGIAERRPAAEPRVIAGPIIAQAEADAGATPPDTTTASPPPEPASYRMGDFRSPVPLTIAGATAIDTVAAERMWRSGLAAFVDVLPRPPKPDLPEGTLWRTTPRSDIPGSIWLVNTGFGALSPEADAYFTAGLERATGGDRERALVFYCLSNCWMSWNAAKRAASSGYRHVLWYREGTDGWAAAGLPLEPRDPEPGEPVRPPE